MRNTPLEVRALTMRRTPLNPTLAAIFFSLLLVLLSACGQVTPGIETRTPVEPEPEPELVVPSEWVWQSIGYDDSTQLQSSAGSEDMVISAAGNDIWGDKDEFFYVYTPLQGDGALSVQLSDFAAAQDWSKAGIMLRESLDPDASNVFIHISGSQGSVLQARSERGGTTVNNGFHQSDVKPGDWIRLIRNGTTVVGEYSTDGESWTKLGSYEVGMGDEAMIGLAVTAHDASNVATATFSDMRFYRGTFNVGGPVEPAPSDPTSPIIGVPSYDLPPATLWVDGNNGSDSNSGRSPDAPLKSVNRANSLVRAGDVVYIRGGVYPINVTFSATGTASQPIVWASYPGETAIFDGSNQARGSSQHRVWVDGANFNHFVNFTVRNSPQQGIFVRNANDNLFHGIVTHGHNASGVQNYSGNRNVYEYLVTYDNFDTVTTNGKIGEDADGIGISSGDGNVIRHVVSFFNSDDGIDAWRSTNTLIEYSIAYDNGRGANGNGNGFKLGGNNEVNRTIARYNIAFDNKAAGFSQNTGREITLDHNTAYNNGWTNYDAGSGVTLRNNISLAGSVNVISGANSRNNSWDLGIDDVRVVSTDRNSPDFLALAAGSPAIDRGIDLGLIFSGSAPDLGALEFRTNITFLRDIRNLLI